jgi:hypothetical protein
VRAPDSLAKEKELFARAMAGNFRHIKVIEH